MKIAVIGASGFIGNAIYSFFSRKSENVVGTFFSKKKRELVYLDATDRTQVSQFFQGEGPQTVIHPQAMPNVERCELEPESCWKNNFEALRNVVDKSKRTNAKLVFFSSDYVFDGINGPYDELAKPNPLNQYGFAKYMCEEYVRWHLPGSLIIRLSVVYGWEREKKNFAAKFIDALRNNEQFLTPVDQFSSPTYVLDIPGAIDILLQKGAQGIFNVAGPETISRYEFGKRICKVFGLTECLAVPKTTRELGQVARRPKHAGLVTDKIGQIGIKLREIEVALRDMKNLEAFSSSSNHLEWLSRKRESESAT